MKVILIAPSNRLFMPYLTNYTLLLDEANVPYDLILWNRYDIQEEASYVYQDHKIGHQRHIWDYLAYSHFIKKVLKNYPYDKVIVFGLQLVFFLKNYLIKHFPGKYIIDIRDYNTILKLFSIEPALQHSYATALSSRGFLTWLPPFDKYIISHNTVMKEIHDFRLPSIKTDVVEIGYIGSVRDYKVNRDLIQQLANHPRYQLNYHGEGIINREINQYLAEHTIENVLFTGKYTKEEEIPLYQESQLINIFRDESHFDNRSALPNRLYNAVIVGRPIIAFKGSYMADIIQQFNLGLLIDSIADIEDLLEAYIQQFNADNFLEGRQQFFERVCLENEVFSEHVLSFVKE